MNQGMYLSAIGAVVAWGSWAFFGKLALRGSVTPLGVYVAEAVAGMVLAGVIVGLAYTRGEAMIQGVLNGYAVLSGLSMAVGLVFFYMALQYGKVSIVVPLTAVYPVVAVLLSIMFLGEWPSLSEWIGIALIGAGVVLLLN